MKLTSEMFGRQFTAECVDGTYLLQVYDDNGDILCQYTQKMIPKISEETFEQFISDCRRKFNQRL